MSDILVNEIADLKARVGELERRMNAVKAQLPDGALDHPQHPMVDPMPADQSDDAQSSENQGGPLGDEEDEAPVETMRGRRR